MQLALELQESRALLNMLQHACSHETCEVHEANGHGLPDGFHTMLEGTCSSASVAKL